MRLYSRDVVAVALYRGRRQPRLPVDEAMEQRVHGEFLRRSVNAGSDLAPEPVALGLSLAPRPVTLSALSHAGKYSVFG
jgi:hypothetical protein